MKIKTIGRRYSKVSVPVGEEGDTFSDFMRWAGKRSKRCWKDYGKEVYAAAVGYLESEELLTTPMVYRWNDMEKWTSEPIPDDLPDDLPWGFAVLSSYVGDQGYKRDSQADIAARIIETSHKLNDAYERGHMDTALDASMEMGVLSQLLLVYSAEDGDRAKAVDNRHENNRSVKDQALAWYDKHKDEYRTKDEAAEKMARLFHRSWSTIRKKWLQGR